MARPTISYNASTGSSSASGSGETLVSGSSATVNGGDPGTVIDLDGSPDLSGLTADTSAIWLSGIGLYRITAIDDGANQVTIHASVSLGGGVAWGIGGTRDNPRSDSFADEDSGEEGWTYEFASGTYDMGGNSFAPLYGSSTDGLTTIRAKAGYSSKPVLTANAGSNVLDTTISNTLVKNIVFEVKQNSAGIYIRATSVNFQVIDCDFTQDNPASLNCWGVDASNDIEGAIFRGCTFYMPGSGGRSFYCPAGRRIAASFIGCTIRGCGTAAFDIRTTSSYGDNYNIFGCTFVSNEKEAIRFQGIDNGAPLITNCAFYNNGTGIQVTSQTNPDHQVQVLNSVFSDNWSAIEGSGTGEGFTIVADYNAFYNNESNYTNVSSGENDITLTVSPFVNISAEDFSPNNNPAGGALIRDAGIPENINIGLPHPSSTVRQII